MTIRDIQHIPPENRLPAMRLIDLIENLNKMDKEGNVNMKPGGLLHKLRQASKEKLKKDYEVDYIESETK